MADPAANTAAASEPYIPASRQDLIDLLCAADGLSAEERVQFRQFCEILSAYAHFTGQKDLELMKLAFANFDPNLSEKRRPVDDAGERENAAQTFVDAFDRTVRRANFRPLPESEVRAALNRASIVPVQTSVDFDAFERFAFYYRTSNEIPITVKRWFRRRTINVGNYDRMAVLLQTKDAAYFDQAGKTLDSNLNPGQIYLNLYKNIPHHDLELLFPNLEISMNLKDKLMLGVPALGAAVPLFLKILPSLGLLIGAVALFVFGFELGGRYTVDGGDSKAVFALLTAVLSISLALGGFAAGQWVKYKSRRLEFLKKVTDVLFFKSLDIGKGVLNALVDSAEEEDCKEMLLVFHILLANRNPMNTEAVDSAAEAWLRANLDADVDFDVTKALDNLENIRGTESDADASIITRETNGLFRVVTINEAKARIDRIWDNAFRY